MPVATDAIRLVLLGPPASGKGTQGRLIAAQFGLEYLSTGKQLRREVRRGSELGAEIDSYLSRNEYVPDRLALAMAEGWLQQVEGGWVLDGFPRTTPQALALDGILGAEAGTLRAALLEVERSVLEGRVAERRECTACAWVGTRDEAEENGVCPACGGTLVQRRDDTPAAFRKRMDVYEELTLPVAGFYEESGRLVRISGVGSPEEVATRMGNALRSHG